MILAAGERTRQNRGRLLYGKSVVCYSLFHLHKP